mmetsp:Transcript_41646/g.67548  ORF Transcript_41646/g.67548 Transcript_41646/m.67548 type:complete len:330 (+) Transcript_41646:24-1013(+)
MHRDEVSKQRQGLQVVVTSPPQKVRRKRRLLDVYTERQGWMQLTLWNTTSAFFILIGGFLFVYYALTWGTHAMYFNFASANGDGYDMITSYQLASRTALRQHLLVQFSGLSASLNGIAPAFQLTQLGGGAVKNPKYMNTIPLGAALKDTDYVQRFLSGVVNVPLVRPIDLSSIVSVSFLGNLTALNQFLLLRDYDAGSATLQRLTGVNAQFIYSYSNPSNDSYSFYRVQPLYGDPVQGSYPGILQTAYSLLSSTTPVQLNIQDALQPNPPQFPEFSGQTAMVVGIAFAAIGAVMLLPLPYFAYIIPRNAKQNQGRPPLFFASMRRYRGW